ncbi:hypothetical protein AVEN_153776-1 [Araneus ventricosus]|uniref:HTH CENPB-type domain-containing protein n=1 Tax=Araneus ventricosus TaxID=182803 RepID=A0A4Y1ZPI8_ARAVE|nr:hypothetical protein AVEN_153776-1 [Araneus ventricosus]
MGKLANRKRKTLKSSPFEELENFMLQWFNEVRSTNIPINGPVLKEKPIEIASKLGIQGFFASNSWIDRFKQWRTGSENSGCWSQ